MRIKSLLVSATVVATLLVVGNAIALPITATAESPRIVPYSGHLDQGGIAVNGTRSLEFSIVNGADAVLWTSAVRDVTIEAGAFSIALGEAPDPAIPDAVFSVEEIYVTVSVEGFALAGRQRVYSQPYAIRATSAYEASAGSPLRGDLDALSAGVEALDRSVGAGIVVRNVNFTNGALPDVFDVGTTRLVLATGNGDYRWGGTTTCDQGRILSLGYTGTSGIVTVQNNACSGQSPCARFLTTSGAAFSMSSGARPAHFMCLNGSWYQM